MASCEKYTHNQVWRICKHNSREFENPGNKDIDPERSSQNYDLLGSDQRAYDRYKERKKELYSLNRQDVKTMAGWVVTVPKSVPVQLQRKFFESVHDFLGKRYGTENCVQSVVHVDEAGMPHLHYNFIPVTQTTKAAHIAKGFTEKICAKAVLNKTEFQNFHSDLQKHLNVNGIPGADVLNGVTARQGGNRTVAELKHATHEKERASKEPGYNPFRQNDKSVRNEIQRGWENK